MEDLAVLIESPTLAAALDKAALVLDCMADEVAWMLISDHADVSAATVRIAALSLANPPEGPGLASWRGGPWRSRPPQEPLLAQPPRKIDGDITVETGKVHHFGDLIVNGSVLRAGSVNARGKVIVYGDVMDAAVVAAGESITIKGGVLGKAHSMRGDVGCRYAQGAGIGGRDIAVQENVVQSRLLAQRDIDIGGSLRGGSAASGRHTQAAIAGAPDAAYRTRIQAGRAHRLRALAETARERLTRIQARLTVVDASVETAGLTRLADIYRAHQARVLQAIEALPDDSSVRIHDSVYPHVTVEIDDARYDVAAEMPCTTFWKDRQTGILKAETYG